MSNNLNEFYASHMQYPYYFRLLYTLENRLKIEDINNEFYEWCVEQFGPPNPYFTVKNPAYANDKTTYLWYFYGGYFHFRYKIDAVAFKLRFG